MGLFATLFYYATLFAGTLVTALAAVTAGEIGEDIDWHRNVNHFDLNDDEMRSLETAKRQMDEDDKEMTLIVDHTINV